MATITFTKSEPFWANHEGSESVREHIKVTPTVDGVAYADLEWEAIVQDATIAEHLEYLHKRGLLFPRP